MPTEEQIATAVKTALDTALSSYGATAGAVKALDYDEAQGVTLEHVQVSAARRFAEVKRAGVAAQSPWRLQTRPVGNTVTNTRNIHQRVFIALSGVRITADGQTSTPLDMESADDIGPDDGKFSGLTTWTFTF